MQETAPMTRSHSTLLLEIRLMMIALTSSINPAAAKAQMHPCKIIMLDVSVKAFVGASRAKSVRYSLSFLCAHPTT
jgi:hypothetical protein